MCAYVLCAHMGGFLNGLPPYFLRRGLSLTLGFNDSARLMSQWVPGSHLSLSPIPRITSMQGLHHPAFTMGAEDLNSGLYECMTSMSETDLASKYLINTHHNYVHWADVVGLDGMWGHTM